MNILTLAEAIDTFGVDVDAHLDRQATIPVHTGRQRQGDVYFRPTKPSAKPGRPVPAEGIAVVRGENGGNTHLLLPTKGVTWAHIDGGGTATMPDLGVITVPKGTVAHLAHPEHGYLAFGPGSYIARRQVEHADTIRVVAD